MPIPPTAAALQAQPVPDALDLQIPAPPPFTFELALVMGGTVSAGAYTAGAVDFLIEALDCFAAQKRESGLPYHDVVLKVLAGTSGGAIVAALLARTLNYQVPPAFAGAQAPAANPLYDVWVNKLDLAPMLRTGDITDIVPSLLNATVIDDTADATIQFVGEVSPPRAWVGAPLRVILTHTNLSGIPYTLGVGENCSERFVDHADYVQFAVTYGWQPATPVPKPYEFTLFFDDRKPQGNGWTDLRDFALASAAFPLGLPTRRLSRPRAHYQYRVIKTAIPPKTAADLWVIQPDWNAMGDNNSLGVGLFTYSAVDGGTINNEPIGLAHDALSGLLGENPPAGNDANRAVLLIDPFAGEADLGDRAVAGVVSTGGATLNALLQHCRYSTADLALAVAPDVYSRFMLQAQRLGAKPGGLSLATGGLDAFLGFASAAFRAHDFQLGRRNCQDFLRDEFTLPSANRLFDNDREALSAFARDGELPLIPLFGSAAQEEAWPAWPVGALQAESLRPGLEARFKAILESVFPQTLLGQLTGLLAANLTEGKAADFAIAQINSALTAWDLLDPAATRG